MVYFEPTSDVWAALAREKQVKNMHRAEKIKLVETLNPEWFDLYETRVAPTPHQILSRQDDRLQGNLDVHVKLDAR
jgi:hypothetical protein